MAAARSIAAKAGLWALTLGSLAVSSITHARPFLMGAVFALAALAAGYTFISFAAAW